MKRKRLSILIYAMLICLALVSCGKSNAVYEINVDEPETETQEGEPKEYSIETSMAVQYSDRDFSVYSENSCFFTITVYIVDTDCNSTNTYGPFEISAGEQLDFSIDELSPDFFSDNAKIEYVFSPYAFTYDDSILSTSNYIPTNADTEFKYYKDKIVLRTNKDCLISFTLQTTDEYFKSGDVSVKMLKLKANEIYTLTLNDLTPGFYSDKAEIVSYSPLSIHTFTQSNH